MSKSDTLLAATQPTVSKKTLADKSAIYQPSEDRIRMAAYLRWEQAGCPMGEDERFWLEAEQELQDTTG